jgi:hypothetical protein
MAKPGLIPKLSKDALTYLPPGDRDAYPERKAEAERLLLDAQDMRVNSSETRLFANEFLLRVKKKYREISDQQAKILDPLKESEDATRFLFRGPLVALAEAEKQAKEKMGSWDLSEKNRVEREQRQAWEQAARVQKEIDDKRAADAKAAADEAAKKALKEAKGSGFSAKEAKEYAALEAEGASKKVLEEPALAVRPKAVDAPPPKTLVTESGRTTTTYGYDFDVLDVNALNAAFPELVEKLPRRRMILDRLKATEGAAIPGLKVKPIAVVSATS